jgi:hypothetical protein
MPFRRAMRLSPLALVLAAACAGDALAPVDDGIVPQFAKPPASTDVLARWMMQPDDGVGFALFGDNLAAFQESGFSRYKDGECSVAAKIFVGASNDATMQTNNPRKKTKDCMSGRQLTLRYYADGNPSETYTETIAFFGNVHAIWDVAPGETMKRAFHINPTQRTRCDAYWFTSFAQGNPVAGDSVTVTASTLADGRRAWHVRNTAGADDRFQCSTDGRTYRMAVDFQVETLSPVN